MKAGIDFVGIGCGAIIVNDKNEVLLVKRAASSRMAAGTWSRPGGQVEFGEKIEEAVEREVLEETGVKVKAERFLELAEDFGNEKHWLAIGYLAKYIAGEARNVEPDKHDEVKWFSLTSLPKLNKYTESSIKKYLELKNAEQ